MGKKTDLFDYIDSIGKIEVVEEEEVEIKRSKNMRRKNVVMFNSVVQGECDATCPVGST